MSQKTLLLLCGGFGLAALGLYALLREEDEQPTPTPLAKAPRAAPQVAMKAPAPDRKPIPQKEVPMQVSHRKPAPATVPPAPEKQVVEESAPAPVAVEKEVQEPVVQASIPILDDSFPLRLGSQGPRVERLQVWLLRNGGHFGLLDDRFDARILKQVRKTLGTETVSRKDFRKHRMNQHVHRQRPLA